MTAGVVPAGGLAAGHLFARHDLNLPAADSRTALLTTRVACGPSLMMAPGAEGSRRRSTLAAGFVRGAGRPRRGCLLTPGTRSFSG